MSYTPNTYTVKSQYLKHLTFILVVLQIYTCQKCVRTNHACTIDIFIGCLDKFTLKKNTQTC